MLTATITTHARNLFKVGLQPLLNEGELTFISRIFLMWSSWITAGASVAIHIISRVFVGFILPEMKSSNAVLLHFLLSLVHSVEH